MFSNFQVDTCSGAVLGDRSVIPNTFTSSNFNAKIDGSSLDSNTDAGLGGVARPWMFVNNGGSLTYFHEHASTGSVIPLQVGNTQMQAAVVDAGADTHGCSVQVTLQEAAASLSSYQGLVFRYRDATHYMAVINNGGTRYSLVEANGGAPVPLAVNGITYNSDTVPNSNDIIQVIYSDTTISVKVKRDLDSAFSYLKTGAQNWVGIPSTSQFSNHYVGIISSATNVGFDNFIVGDCH